MILKLTKIKLNPFTASPSKDISLNSAVKFGKCYSYILKYDLQKNFDSVLERYIFSPSKIGNWEKGEVMSSRFFYVISL